MIHTNKFINQTVGKPSESNCDKLSIYTVLGFMSCSDTSILPNKIQIRAASPMVNVGADSIPSNCISEGNRIIGRSPKLHITDPGGQGQILRSDHIPEVAASVISHISSQPRVFIASNVNAQSGNGLGWVRGKSLYNISVVSTETIIAVRTPLSSTFVHASAKRKEIRVTGCLNSER